MHISTLLLPTVYVSLLYGVSACSGDTTGPKHPLTPAQAYWSLKLNQHAVTLALTAPVNTIQLNATPLNVDGTPISGIGPVHYASSSPILIHVDSTGFVTAQGLTNQQFVVASLYDSNQNITHVDTCFFSVTAIAPNARLAGFSIQPVNGDSARRSINSQSNAVKGARIYAVVARAKDSSSAVYNSFFSYFYSRNRNIAAIDARAGFVYGLKEGSTTLYAQTWAYGVAALDSLQFEITPALATGIQILPVIPTGSSTPTLTFWPQVVTVGVGATVVWQQFSRTIPIDVVFDDPTNVDSIADSYTFFGFSFGSGNMSQWVYDTVGIDRLGKLVNEWYKINFPQLTNPCFNEDHGRCGNRWRSFPVAGIYHYHSTVQPASGTVVVK